MNAVSSPGSLLTRIRPPCSSAIVKSIAELHGGRVRVRSEPGLETAFVLSLPAAGRT